MASSIGIDTDGQPFFDVSENDATLQLDEDATPYYDVAFAAAPMLSTSDSQRTNVSVSGPSTLSVSVAGTNDVQVNGLIAQILPNGETPEPGGFISGQGHSGLRLNSDPMITQYSANIPNAQIGVSAEFIETGAWE